MLKYVTKNWLHDENYSNEDATNDRSMTVQEAKEEPVYTGLLDLHGNDLYRLSAQKQLGFKLY